jgi:membrane protein DedA with SNARE-associated domain
MLLKNKAIIKHFYMNHHTIKAGTIGGTLAGIMVNISGTDIVRTVILAGIGAAVSFIVSFLLKRTMQQYIKTRWPDFNKRKP